MIQKLRFKLILIMTLSMVGVMIVMAAAINLTSYRTQIAEADRLLRLITENDGVMPVGDKPGGDNEIGNPGLLAVEVDVSLEDAYRTRYFSVFFDEFGEITEIKIDVYSNLTEEEVREMAVKSLQNNSDYGEMGVYRYLVSDRADGGRIAVFLNFEEVIQFSRSLLKNSLIVGSCAFLLVLLLVIPLSFKAVQPAVRTQEQQKQFLTDAGHELKTPLTIISADVEVLELSGNSSEWLTSIKKQTQRLSDLVEEIVLINRLDEKNDEEMVLSRFDLSEAVADAAQSFCGIAETRGIPYTREIESGLSMTGHEAEIRGLCSVLLDNAFKYVDEGGEVIISLHGGKKLTLEVQNDFAEVGSMDMDRIFDRFYRADEARSATEGKRSFGLGLSMAEVVVRHHGGKLSARESAPGIFAISAVFDPEN